MESERNAGEVRTGTRGRRRGRESFEARLSERIRARETASTIGVGDDAEHEGTHETYRGRRAWSLGAFTSRAALSARTPVGALGVDEGDFKCFAMVTRKVMEPKSELKSSSARARAP